MDAFDYYLPDHAIAQEPAEPRTSARLMVATDPAGRVRHALVSALPCLLDAGDLLVLNDTRVIPARLRLRKATGGAVEVLLLEPRTHPLLWHALVRRSSRVPPGTTLYWAERPAVEVGGLTGGGRRLVRLVDSSVITKAGTVALPPYIRRELEDPERYQTVYSRQPGSVAAPTAGLHLSQELLDRCTQRGAAVATVDLAVGMDTFRPISASKAEAHEMHSERYRVPPETMEACRQAARVVAVGTTAVRALESVALTGELCGRTSLFIRRPFDFRVVDVLLTNFHLPRSSLLVMLEAFCGPRWRDIYSTALEERYRFLSFGDAMIVGKER